MKSAAEITNIVQLYNAHVNTSGWGYQYLIV